MSLQNAWRFIGAVRQDAALASCVAQAASLSALCDIAGNHGWPCSEKEMRDAFSADWTMRRVAQALDKMKKQPVTSGTTL